MRLRSSTQIRRDQRPRGLRRLPSPSMAVAVGALVFAAGGTAFAAGQLPARSVGAKQLKSAAVERAKIKTNAVNGAKVAADSLTGLDIKESSLAKVPAATLADNATNATNATHASASGALDRVTYKTAGGTAPAASPFVGSATASCDAGQHVTGGGVKVDDVNNAFVLDDYPDGDNTAWTAHVAQAGGAAVGFTVFAICVPTTG